MFKFSRTTSYEALKACAERNDSFKSVGSIGVWRTSGSALMVAAIKHLDNFTSVYRPDGWEAPEAALPSMIADTAADLGDALPSHAAFIGLGRLSVVYFNAFPDGVDIIICGAWIAFSGGYAFYYRNDKTVYDEIGIRNLSNASALGTQRQPFANLERLRALAAKDHAVLPQ